MATPATCTDANVLAAIPASTTIATAAPAVAASSSSVTSVTAAADDSSAASSSPSASPDTDPIHRFLYFAYGSNMLPSMLKLKKVHVHSQRQAILPDMKLLFDLTDHSLVEPSYANLQHVLGSKTHGVLYELESRDMATMDTMEGGGSSYIRELFDVQLYADRDSVATGGPPRSPPLRAYAYICYADNLLKVILKPTPPSKRYLDVLVRGAKFHGLDSDYVAWLESQPSTPLPKLQLTPEQLHAIEARVVTLEQLQAATWKSYMDDSEPSTWQDPLFVCLKGIIFDISQCGDPPVWKKFCAGKCLTCWTAGRVAGDGAIVPSEVSHFTQEHQAYINATIMDYCMNYKIIGHMEDREKYKF